MAEKIVVLNSGGFDSVCLMHYVRDLHGEGAGIYSLHFLYGARNQAQQAACVEGVCKKLGAFNNRIPLPEFSWTSGDFYGLGCTHDGQYLEYRNLVFLSYALSYAQSIGAGKVYWAVLHNGRYVDTNARFLRSMASVARMGGIELCSPFSKWSKKDLVPYVEKYGITSRDYFTCDTPVNGKPCGECPDCRELDLLFPGDREDMGVLRTKRRHGKVTMLRQK